MSEFSFSTHDLLNRDKTVYKKNKLKDLIYIQENKPCNEQTVNGLFRSIVEPILEHNVEGLVLFRLKEKSVKSLSSLLRRLEYSNAKVYDFSNKAISEKFENVLKENIWGNTEFVYVLAQRFGAVLIFDYQECEVDGYAQIYTLYNSKNLSESFDEINANSTVDLSEFQEMWHPDRRENDILNNSIIKIVESLNETNQEVMISQLTKEEETSDEDLASRLDFLLTKSSYIAHEMRNLLSICNLYSDIIEKQTPKVSFETPEVKTSVLNARGCIKKSMIMLGNLLLDFRSLKNTDLKTHNLDELVTSAAGLAKSYGFGKKIEFNVEIPENAIILVDENKFLTVLINLIKNGVENIEETGKIEVKTEVLSENVKISVSNSGKPISKDLQERIFEQGFTTKASGSGLGLAICKKTLEEQFAQLELKKSDEDSTEFQITLLRGE